jgi:hypothetical protein
MYKCIEGGATTYAERPCGKSAVAVGKPALAAAAPASVPANAAAAPAAVGSDPLAGRQDQLTTMARERRIRAMVFEIRDAEREMDDELDMLKRRQASAANNLAGATWISGIAQEMQAVTAKHSARIDALRRDLAELRRQ